jgi:transcriptional regulator with XRE-family HTH domain
LEAGLQKPTLSPIDVSARLRQLRLERGHSLRSLAQRSGLSTNALSMIERERSSPSVSTLYKLAEALEVPITAFFRTQLPRQAIVFMHEESRPRVEFTRGIWEGLGGESFSGRVEPFIMTLESGGTSGPHGLIHSGHEFVLCMEGSLDYEVEGERFSLKSGDSLLFTARMRHRWRNPGSSVTRVLIVLSGFELDESPAEFHQQTGNIAE